MYLLFFWRLVGDGGRKGRGEKGDSPVFHVGLFRVGERVEYVLFFALGEFRHEVDEGRHENEANERIRISISSGVGEHKIKFKIERKEGEKKEIRESFELTDRGRILNLAPVSLNLGNNNNACKTVLTTFVVTLDSFSSIT